MQERETKVKPKDLVMRTLGCTMQVVDMVQKSVWEVPTDDISEDPLTKEPREATKEEIDK